MRLEGNFEQWATFPLSNQRKMQEHLMVDGNNALHAIPSLAKELAADRSQARDSLLRLLEPLVTGDHRALTVVFDGRGGRSSLSKHANMKNYTVIHSSSSQGSRRSHREDVDGIKVSRADRSRNQRRTDPQLRL